MTHLIVNGQNKQPHGSVRELLSKHNSEGQDEANVKRERFLAMLKSRYGYTNEKAVDELERLLRQFYRVNKSSGTHRARSGIKHSPLE
jgi:hypothetical protein